MLQKLKGTNAFRKGLGKIRQIGWWVVMLICSGSVSGTEGLNHLSLGAGRLKGKACEVDSRILSLSFCWWPWLKRRVLCVHLDDKHDLGVMFLLARAAVPGSCRELGDSAQDTTSSIIGFGCGSKCNI